MCLRYGEFGSTTGCEGKYSNTGPAWQRISELHAQWFGLSAPFRPPPPSGAMWRTRTSLARCAA